MSMPSSFRLRPPSVFWLRSKNPDDFGAWWPSQSLSVWRLLGSLLAFALLLTELDPVAAQAQTLTRSRVVFLPLSTPPGMEGVSPALSRMAIQQLLQRVDVIEVRDAQLPEGKADCIYDAKCSENVLSRAKADAMLSGFVEVPEGGGAGSLLLVVLAPRWPVSYVERRISLNDPNAMSQLMEVLNIASNGVVMTQRERVGKLEPYNPEGVQTPVASDAGFDEPLPGEEKQRGKETAAEKKARLAREQAEKDEKRRQRELEAQEKLAKKQRDEQEKLIRKQQEEAEKLAKKQREEAEREEKRLAALAEEESEQAEKASQEARSGGKEARSGSTPSKSSGTDPKSGSKPSKSTSKPVDAEPIDEPNLDSDLDELPQDVEQAKKKSSGSSKKSTSRPSAAPVKRSSRPQKPALALSWPERKPRGSWFGGVVEVHGGGAYGALKLNINSEVAVDEYGQVLGSYLWILRENASTAGVKVQLGWALGELMEVGAAMTLMPTSKQALLLTFWPDPVPDDAAQDARNDLTYLVEARMRYFFKAAPALRPYVGVGLGVWLIPGYAPFDALATSHPDFLPVQRFSLSGQGGVRVLIQPRMFFSAEGSLHVDPGPAYLAKDLSADNQIPVSELVTPPPAARSLGSVMFGLGWLL